MSDSGNWNPFTDSLPRSASDPQAARQLEDKRQLARVTFSTPAGRRFLELLRQEEDRPSYQPGDTFDAVAFREGRKSVLRDIDTLLTAPEQEPA